MGGCGGKDEEEEEAATAASITTLNGDGGDSKAREFLTVQTNIDSVI